MTNRVEYVKGERNVAGLFSRPVVSAHSDLNSILPDPERFVIDYMEMATEQHNDQEVQNLKNNNGTGLRLEVLLSDTGLTILFDNSQGRLRPVISKSMRFAVFRHFNSTSHPGVRAGNKLIFRLAVWYDMRRNITRWTKECARSKVYRHTKATLQIVMPPPKGRFTSMLTSQDHCPVAKDTVTLWSSWTDIFSVLSGGASHRNHCGRMHQCFYPTLGKPIWLPRAYLHRPRQTIHVKSLVENVPPLGF